MAKKPSKEKIKPYDYAKICKIWSLSDHWPLADAVNLLVGLPPQLLASRKISPALKQMRDELHEIALNCAGDSLIFIEAKGLPEQHRVRPREFLAWAYSVVEVPEELIKAVEEAAQRPGRKNTPRAFNPKQRHRERCRGIAALLWRMHPELNKSDMAREPQILELGCQNKIYAQTTIEEWIASENPNKKGGRPKGSEK
ncbi:MAG: hypothetical protein ACYC9J_15195 [Sulfuricaulis sp.]